MKHLSWRIICFVWIFNWRVHFCLLHTECWQYMNRLLRTQSTFMIQVHTDKRTYSNWWIPTSFPYRSLETVDEKIHRGVISFVGNCFKEHVQMHDKTTGKKQKVKPLGSLTAAQALLPEQWRLWGSLCVEALTEPSLDLRCSLPPAALHRQTEEYKQTAKPFKVTASVPQE